MPPCTPKITPFFLSFAKCSNVKITVRFPTELELLFLPGWFPKRAEVLNNIWKVFANVSSLLNSSAISERMPAFHLDARLYSVGQGVAYTVAKGVALHKHAYRHCI